MFSVQGKIKGLLLFNPGDTEWQWTALDLLPRRTFHGRGCVRCIVPFRKDHIG